MIDPPSSPSPEWNFAELVELAGQGNLDAQDRLCREYESKVRIVARVLLGPALRPQFDSMDIVQSVHRSLLIGLRDQRFDISSPEKLVALASTMVRRKVARKWRTERRRRPEGAAPVRLDELPQMLESLSSPDLNPGKVAEFHDQVAHVCEHLNDVEKRMLQLRLDGHTAPEVAALLGMHPVAVRVRWTRLRQRLQDAGIASDWL